MVEQGARYGTVAALVIGRIPGHRVDLETPEIALGIELEVPAGKFQPDLAGGADEEARQSFRRIEGDERIDPTLAPIVDGVDIGALGDQMGPDDMDTDIGPLDPPLDMDRSARRIEIGEIRLGHDRGVEI